MISVNTDILKILTLHQETIFDSGLPSPDVSCTLHIDHKNITKPWKSQKQYAYMYRNRSEPQATPITDPVPTSTTAEDNAPAYDGPNFTLVKFRRMNTFTARQNIIMAAAQHVPAKMILDSGAGISGVEEQWKLTDISRMSSMSILGAFGDSMRPSIHRWSPWTWEASCRPRAWNERWHILTKWPT